MLNASSLFVTEKIHEKKKGKLIQRRRAKFSSINEVGIARETGKQEKHEENQATNEKT